MPKLTMLQGLPGSGKSTWALRQVASQTGIVRVNKDEIRQQLERELPGWKWSQENEKQVEAMRDVRILIALHDGFDVISDDTNFARRHKARLESLARQKSATFEIKRFVIPIEECIANDITRDGKARVGEAVIRRMVKDFNLDKDPTGYGEQPAPPVPVEHVPGARSAIICDLDGTLALFEKKGHRGPYDASLAGLDELNMPVWAVLWAMYDKGHDIILVSGRSDEYKSATQDWLFEKGVPYKALYMRAKGDTCKDWIVKSEIFDAHIRGQWNVSFVLDDRDQVVDFWRSLGLTVFQVAKGDF